MYKNVSLLFYHIHTVFLFTYSDIFTIIVPETLFALLSTLSGTVLTTAPRPSIGEVLHETPVIVFWIWINLLPFAVDNQRHAEAIAEDLLNKPWRPLPARRISSSAARTVMLALYPCTLLAGFCIGGGTHCMAGIVLGY